MLRYLRKIENIVSTKNDMKSLNASDRDEWMSVMDNDAFKLYGNEKEEVKKIEVRGFQLPSFICC